MLTIIIIILLVVKILTSMIRIIANFFFRSFHHNGADVLMTCASYLHYPVFGLQAGALSWRALVHGSDVLARPCALAVQVEAISVGASLDHTEPWPQLGALLLDGGQATKGSRETDRQTGALIRWARWPKTQSSSKTTSTIAVCSERTRGTKMMESSSESLTMKMKPRLNMQVAAACWTLPRSGKQSCRSTPRDSKLLSRKENGPQRHVIGGLLGKKNPGGQFGEGAWSSGGRSRIREGPRLCGGQWELGVDPLPASQFSQSHAVLLWDGRKSGSCFVIQENTGAQTESLPSSVWMRRVLYLAREV